MDKKEFLTNKYYRTANKACEQFGKLFKICTEKEYVEHFSNDLLFNNYYEQWISSGNGIKKAPKILRIDKSKDFVPSNLRARFVG